MSARAAEIGSSGPMVMGSTIMALSLRFTLSTSAAWRSMDILRCTMPMPPCCARAIARCDSVTVSMAAETMGILRAIWRVRQVRVSVSAGTTSLRAGSRRTSSKVSASGSMSWIIRILYMIAWRPPPRDSLERMNWLGWALWSAVFAALTAILAKIGVAGVDSTLATAVRTCVVLVFTWIMVWVNPAARGFSGLTPRNWGFLALSGVATGLSWLCYFRALQMGQASRVAPIDKLSVALVIVLGTLVLGERMTWAKGIGGLLIVAGAVVIALER